MYHWTADGIGWMADASRQTDFYRLLAAELAPYLKPEDRICDAGCGLGFLSLALSPYVRSVTAAERDRRALAVLERELSRRQIENVYPCCTDVLTHTPPQPSDAMVFCFFGSMDEILTAASAQCRGRVLVVKRDQTDHRFTVTKQPLGGTHGLEAACRRLEELGIPYDLKRTAFRFDQPFRSWEDARRFFALYRRGDDAALITDDFLRERLERTDDPQFLWRLPSLRRLGLLALDALQIPDLLHHEVNQEVKPEENRKKTGNNQNEKQEEKCQ